jgi:Ion transport protein
MQQQIRTSHFSRATLYALMANCLQFQKEGQANPGNAGNSRTRAFVCELLAIKLLKEYNTRELIDALSYDFFPLQGLSGPGAVTPGMGQDQRNKARPAAARISTLEVAIRASAKRFLAHPLVVQQLEAIWAGTIVFHSAADNLHRKHSGTPQMQEHRKPNDSTQHLLVPGQNVTYGSMPSPRPHPSPDKPKGMQQLAQIRRTVTLYDPRDASLFKLSRLRVPRYRQFFSTCSLAILLCLFLAVLSQRSTNITPLEIVFWFWSAGFMLDEVVGFNEQGFSLYIMSFWNTFDLGILLLLIIYYSMRLYGIFLVDVGREEWNSMAYDVLATNAILLFPRLFSVLDHYRYFSQLLIAFRLMAVDLVAVFVLILIACSGFFVAFTLSFGKNEYDAAGVAYKIFQILMGFTPAAWEAWPTYNPLGKAILVLFLFICHFLVVTILITVLTNSFLAISSNAEQEHQFVFAVNTISMVKNDALFSYVAPTNIIAWLLTPLRACLPFRVFIKANRTVIKVTHFPLLFGIYAYERLFLARSVFEPTDLVENRGRRRVISFQDAKPGLFSPSIRMRQESVAGYQKDRALDEVFRLAPRADTLRTSRKSLERRQKLNVVNNWMDHQSGIASPPQEQDRSVVDRLEMRRQARKATLMRHRGVSGTRSVASDPVGFMSTRSFGEQQGDDLTTTPDINDHTDGDGDDELNTYEDPDERATLTKDTITNQSHATSSGKETSDNEEDYFLTPNAPRLPQLSGSASSPKGQLPPHVTATAHPKLSPPKRRGHNRNLSTNTILYNPVSELGSSPSPPKSRPLTAKYQSQANTGTHTPTAAASGHRTPRHSIYNPVKEGKTKPRPILPSRQQFQSIPNFNIDERVMGTGRPRPVIRHRRSSLDMGMSELGLESNAPGMQLGAVPSSFATQLAMATGAFGGRTGANTEGESEKMMGRLMLARMKTLEEGFAEVVKEFRGLRTAGNSSVENDLPARDKGKGKERDRRSKKKGMVRTTSEIDFAKMGKGKGKENEDADIPEGELPSRYKSKGSSL